MKDSAVHRLYASVGTLLSSARSSTSLFHISACRPCVIFTVNCVLVLDIDRSSPAVHDTGTTRHHRPGRRYLFVRSRILLLYTPDENLCGILMPRVESVFFTNGPTKAASILFMRFYPFTGVVSKILLEIWIRKLLPSVPCPRNPEESRFGDLFFEILDIFPRLSGTLEM